MTASDVSEAGQSTTAPEGVPIQDTYWVVPGRFLAGRYPGDCYEQIARERMSSLVNAGIRTVINLMEEHEIQKFGAVPSYDHLLRTLAAEGNYDVTYLRIPIKDRSVPPLRTIRHVLEFIDRALQDGGVFVHCWAGRGRTGTIVGCYLRRHGIVSPDSVIWKINEMRKGMSNNHKPSPETEEQIRMVVGWPQGI